jgi:tRNA(Ile2) C34 agmatinyltransferase TiaS
MTPSPTDSASDYARVRPGVICQFSSISTRLTIMRRPVWTKCPVCQLQSGLLNVALSKGDENYYECEDCEHTWRTHQQQPAATKPNALQSNRAPGPRTRLD